MRFYEYKHIVGFEETNLVGNVYFANFIRWQGRCREMFVRHYAPDISQLLEQNLALVTTRTSCEFLAEAVAFDEISIRMKLAALKQNRISMRFEYWRILTDNDSELIARGEQEIACMQREDGTEGRKTNYVPTQIPETLRAALENYL